MGACASATSESVDRIRRELEALADPAYRDFQARLVPTVDPARPHGTYDENNLHGELVGRMAKTPAEAFELLDAFLPYVDNWATCDLIRVPAFRRDLPAVLERIRGWVTAEPEYTVRFGVVQLMTLFLDDAFEPEHLALVAGIDRPEYYVNMARAWYFSFSLIKQPAATLHLFKRRPIALDAWTHNKALQKARESRRIAPEQKAHLQSLKAEQKAHLQSLKV